MLVKLVLGLDDGGQFGLGKEGVVYSVWEGRECGGTSDGIAVKDGAFLVIILVTKGKTSLFLPNNNIVKGQRIQQQKSDSIIVYFLPPLSGRIDLILS